LKAAFNSEVHRLAILSCTPQIYSEQLLWLRSLYISRGYPPQVVLKWTKNAHENAYKNRLQWKPSEEKDGLGVWPLKSVMNPVWQSLDFSSLSEEIADYGLRLDQDPLRIAQWRKRIVAALRRPQNMGDKENLYNRRLCNLTKQDTKLMLSVPDAHMSDASSDSLEVLPPGVSLPGFADQATYVERNDIDGNPVHQQVRSQPPSPSRGGERVNVQALVDLYR
jgi:hypothetical protein